MFEESQDGIEFLDGSEYSKGYLNPYAKQEQEAELLESPPTDVIEVKTGLGNSGKTASAKVDI